MVMDKLTMSSEAVPQSKVFSVTEEERVLQYYQTLAEIFVKSRMIPGVINPFIALSKMLYGRELGFGPIASLQFVHLFPNGTPGLHYVLINSAIERHPLYSIKVIKTTREECTIEYYKKDLLVGTVTTTFQEAKDTGLAWSKEVDPKTKERKLKDNWARWTDDLLFARNISKGSKRYFPDLFNGFVVYTDVDMDVDLTNPLPLTVELETPKQLENVEPKGELVDAEFTIPDDPFEEAKVLTEEEKQEIRDKLNEPKVFQNAVDNALKETSKKGRKKRDPNFAQLDEAKDKLKEDIKILLKDWPTDIVVKRLKSLFGKGTLDELTIKDLQDLKKRIEVKK